ncbi:MAG TPA: hypothetical protein PLK34_02230 [Candidatus Pacearchaeota archaeon]|nr:hypothetical protein [Candidatus Pacearchaeota archaeon]
MHERKRIGVDLDGVVYDFVRYYDLFLSLEGHKVDPTRFDRGVLEEHMKDYYLSRFSDLHPFLWIPLYENALNSLEELSQNFDLYFVTARNLRMKFGEKDTLARLKKDKLPCTKIFFDHDKAKIAKEFGLAYFVEDNLQNARDIVEKTKCKVGLINWEYNQYSDNSNLERGTIEKINRVNDLPEFANFALNDSGILVRNSDLITVPGLI